MDLDKFAIKSGTDKSSKFHYYTDIYEGYLSHLQQKAIKFLEIGIYEGASVKMWEDYFPKAELHFIDNNPSIIKYHSKRSNYHFLNQASRGELLNFVNDTGGDFDIIVDDGGHRIDQQIISFQMLFPHLKSGGLYIIEDIFTSYLERYGGEGSKLEPQSGPKTTIAFFKFLIDELNYIPSMTGCSDEKKAPEWITQGLSYYQKAVKSLHFHRGLGIIEKS